MFIDTHAHLDGEEFREDLPAVLQRAREAGAAAILIPAIDEPSAQRAVELSRQQPSFLYPMLGLHPEDLPDDWQGILQCMEKQLQQPNPYVAIGEVGLDFYWDDSRRSQQFEAFRIQIEWSLKYNLPLMIHARKAHQEILDSLRPYDCEKLCGVFHCFSGTAEEAAALLAFPHFFLGIGGVLTFKKSTLPEVLGQVPLERLVLETDSPYMAPVPNRGKRNEPSFIPHVIQKLSDIYGVPPSEVERITTANAVRLFHLPLDMA